MTKIKEDEIGRACNTHGEVRNAYKILIGKIEGKRPLRRHKHKWEDFSSIKIDFNERELEGVDWINLAQDRDQWWALTKMVYQHILVTNPCLSLGLSHKGEVGINSLNH
jgi:hypothetical protein